MSAVVVNVRAELEARAGASDTDAAWHEERAHAATATGVRDVWLMVQDGATIENAAEAVARKRLARRGGAGPEAAWGVQREPVLAAYMQRQYGIAPESRVFRSAENPRWLASPDGVGIDFDERIIISEVKTGAPRFFGYEQMVAKGYIVQQTWAMGVLGAVENRGKFEERLGSRQSGFEAGRSFEWTVRWADVAQMFRDELVPMGNALIAALDRLSDASAEDIDRDLDALAVDVVHGREMEADGKALKESSWKALQEALKARPRVEQESPFARLLWTPEERGTKPHRVVDEKHAEVVAARQAVVDAQVALVAVEEKHSRTEMREVVTKKAGLTVSDPQKRKAEK